MRCSGLDGTVAEKGIQHITLKTAAGRLALLPNRLALASTLEILGEESTLVLHLAVATENGSEAASGLIRHAAALAGLDREDGRIELTALREASMVYRVEWPLPSGARDEEVRSGLLEALLAHAPGLGVRVISASRRPDRAS